MKIVTRSIPAVMLSLAAVLGAQGAHAQVDLSGTWEAITNQDQQSRGNGPDGVSYLGIPLTDQARQAALSFTTNTINEVHRECQPWPVHYLLTGPFGFRISATLDSDTGKVIAWNLSGAIDRAPVTIWVDGRDAPSPQAMDTPSGFTTGRWEGNTLVTTTTHIQDGYLTRNGVPNSDREVLTMYITRHGELIEITGIVQDPIYLAAPYVLNGFFKYNANASVDTTPNMPATCTPEEEISGLESDSVPNYRVPSDNPNLNYVTKLYNIPLDAVLGGAQTMFPEYARKLNEEYKPPAAYCTFHCCGTQGDLAFITNVLKCTIGLGGL